MPLTSMRSSPVSSVSMSMSCGALRTRCGALTRFVADSRSLHLVRSTYGLFEPFDAPMGPDPPRRLFLPRFSIWSGFACGNVIDAGLQAAWSPAKQTI